MFPPVTPDGRPVLDRRGFLRGSLAAGAAAAAAPGLLGAAPAREAGEVFVHGVASGDPLADRVVLWTRISCRPGTSVVRWTVATDPDLSDVVARGRALARPERDHCVKVDAGGLSPGTTYHYGFRVAGVDSPVGRTRTAPTDSPEQVRLAVVSCSNYTTGFFNAYAALATRDDLDAVLHVGDWFYENPGEGPDGRVHEPPRELVSLDDYRTRHAQYRTDDDLRAVMAAHPFVVVWDDHESTNNGWADGAGNHQPDTEGDWQVRKRASARAYAEWMPIRLPDESDPLTIWRRLRYGDLVDVFMLDTRLQRTHPEIADVNDPAADDDGRSMLGAAQKAWLLDGLSTSTARWRVLGQQTMMSPHRGFTQGEVPLPHLPDDVAEELGVRQGGGAEGTDNWGAYAAERAQLLDHLRSDAVPAGNVVLAGDIHTAWAADVVEDPYSPLAYQPLTGAGSAAVELVCPSVTSNNAIDFVAEAPGVAEAVAEGYNLFVEQANPNVVHHDVAIHGFVLVDLTHDRVRGEFWQTGPARVRNATARLDTVVESTHGTEHLVATLDPSATPVPGPVSSLG